jgi:hypothetical protein
MRHDIDVETAICALYICINNVDYNTAGLSDHQERGTVIHGADSSELICLLQAFLKKHMFHVK